MTKTQYNFISFMWVWVGFVVLFIIAPMAAMMAADTPLVRYTLALLPIGIWIGGAGMLMNHPHSDTH